MERVRDHEECAFVLNDPRGLPGQLKAEHCQPENHKLNKGRCFAARGRAETERPQENQGRHC